MNYKMRGVEYNFEAPKSLDDAKRLIWILENSQNEKWCYEAVRVLGGFVQEAPTLVKPGYLVRSAFGLHICYEPNDKSSYAVYLLSDKKFAIINK